MGEQDRLAGRLQRVEGGLVAAMGDVNGHTDLLHPLHDRRPENRKAAVAPLQKAAADPVVEVVRQLRDPLSEAEELVHVGGRTEVGRFLERQHDADSTGLLGALDVLQAADPLQQVGMGGEEAVPASEKAQGVLVVAASRTEREYVDAGREVRGGVGGSEGLGPLEPAFDPGRFLGEVLEAELVEKVHHGRFFQQPDRPRGVGLRRLREQGETTAKNGGTE